MMESDPAENPYAPPQEPSYDTSFSGTEPSPGNDSLLVVSAICVTLGAIAIIPALVLTVIGALSFVDSRYPFDRNLALVWLGCVAVCVILFGGGLWLERRFWMSATYLDKSEVAAGSKTTSK